MASDPAGPIFGRDSPDAAWRPTPELLHESRLARFLRATGEPSLEALQARAVADPGWFWGAAADDIGVAWQRRPSEVLDASRGPAWARWWGGGAFDYARAATEPRAAARSRGRGARLGGRGWRRPPADQRRAPGRGRGGRAPLPRARDPRRGPGRDPAAAAPGDGDHGARARPDRRDLHPDLLGLRRPGRGHAARRLRRERARHGRRVPATRFVGAAQGRRGRGRGARADRSPDPRRPPGGRCRRRAVEPGSRRLVARGAGDADPARRHRHPTPRPTPRRRTCSSTPRARPAGRRRRSTCTAASRSRARRTSRTSSTCARATRCSGSPTSAG